jgi:hypothetical protein
MLTCFVEVPAVSVVKIEMLEKGFDSNNEFMVTFFIEINYTIKFIFKADSINLASVEEVPFYLLTNYREIVLRSYIKKAAIPLF